MAADHLESTDTSSENKDTNASLEGQKVELAQLYLHTLDTKREDLLGTAASMGVKLNPFKEKAIKYLLNKKGSLISQIGDNFKYAAIKAATNKANLNLEYDRKQLDTMKHILKNIQTADQLSSLKKQIEEGKDISTISVDNQTVQPSNSDGKKDKPLSPIGSSVAIKSTMESLQDDTNRAKVVSKLDEVLAYDKNHPIKYSWGGRSQVDHGLDCSGLLIYTMQQAGFKAPGGDSRDIFSHVPTHKVDITNPKDSLVGVKPGDAIFWNATNPKYHWSSGSVPKIEKDGSSYKIHHIAFVKDISSDGKITIVESSGSKGVTERVVDPAHELADTKHKSELYIGQINYDNLLAYQAKPDEELLAAA